jgi:hypothetical protein
MITNKQWAYDVLILIWSVTFLSSVAIAAPEDYVTPESPEGRTLPQVFTSDKPVTCTTDTYDEVKKNFLESHGEVGLMRFISDGKTGVEVIGNVDTGSITILEFIPSNKYTCFISVGKKLEVNSNIFEKAKQGIQTSY